jgi:hypothetical protein
MSDEIDLEGAAPWLVVLLTLAGAALRALLLDMKGLGLDETVNIWLASHPLSEMMTWISNVNQQPPLYYYLLHTWISLRGDAPYAVRFLSVLLGTATIPMIYLTGKRLANTLVGLAAAVLLAVSPFHIYYAQEASLFTLLTFNASVALYALIRLLTDERSVRPFGSQFKDYLHAWRTLGPEESNSERDFYKKRPAADQKGLRAWVYRHRWLPIHSISTDLSWLALVIFTAATLLSHRTGWLFLASINVFVLGLKLLQKRRRLMQPTAFHAPSIMNWLLAQVVTLTLWLAWLLPTLLKHGTAAHANWLTSPNLADILYALKTFLNTSPFTPVNIARGIWGLLGVLILLGIIFFRRAPAKLLFLVTLFALPFALELLVSHWNPMFDASTLIWTTLALYLLIAAGITKLKFRGLIFLMLGLVATFNLFAASDYFRFIPREDWLTPAKAVVGHAEKGDLVLFNTNLARIPFDYYVRPYLYGAPADFDEVGLPLDLHTSGAAEPVMTTADVPALNELLKGHQRVWLVYSQNNFTDPDGLIPQTLGEQLQLAESQEFYGGVVQLYLIH